MKKPRRKRKRGKAKQQAIPNVSNISSNVTTPSAPALATSESTVTPLNAHPSPERALPPPKSASEASLTRDSSCVDLQTCSDVQYEVRDGVHGVSYLFSSDEGTGWTPVVGRRQKRKAVPDFVRRRFPPGHPIHRSNSDSDSGSEDPDLDTVIPTRASVDVQFKVIDNTPGLAVKTQNTLSWTLIATMQDKSQTEKVTFKLADFRTRVHACISIYRYFMYPLLKCINYYSKKIYYTPSGKKKNNKVMLRKATKVHVYLQCFSLSLSKPERTS